MNEYHDSEQHDGAPTAKSPYTAVIESLEKAVDSISAAGRTPGAEMIVRFKQAAQRQPGLTFCTHKSIIDALCTANRLNVDFATPHLGEAFLEARNNKKKINGREEWVKECRLGLMYAGRIKVAMEAGAIKDVYAAPVFHTDDIKIVQGTSHSVHHEPDLTTPTTFDRLLGCYAVVVLADGTPRVVWLSKDKIESARAKADKSSLPWQHEHDAVEMGCKTALNLILKSVPKTGADIYEPDDDSEPAQAQQQQAGVTLAQKLLEQGKAPLTMDIGTKVAEPVKVDHAPPDQEPPVREQPAPAEPAPTPKPARPVPPKPDKKLDAVMKASRACLARHGFKHASPIVVKTLAEYAVNGYGGDHERAEIELADDNRDWGLVIRELQDQTASKTSLLTV